jgi:hypothetical protein
MVPLIGASNDTEANLVAGDHTENKGVKGDGLTKYIDTNTIPTIFPGGFTVDFRGPTAASGALWGAYDGTDNIYNFRRQNSSSGFAGWGGQTGAVCNCGWSALDSIAFWHQIRKLQNSQKAWKNGVLHTSNAVNATIPAFTGPTIAVMARNLVVGSPDQYSAANTYFSGYAIDDGTMPEADEPAWSAAWAAFRTAMGRP